MLPLPVATEGFDRDLLLKIESPVQITATGRGSIPKYINCVLSRFQAKMISNKR